METGLRGPGDPEFQGKDERRPFGSLQTLNLMPLLHTVAWGGRRDEWGRAGRPRRSEGAPGPIRGRLDRSGAPG